MLSQKYIIECIIFFEMSKRCIDNWCPDTTFILMKLLPQFQHVFYQSERASFYQQHLFDMLCLNTNAVSFVEKYIETFPQHRSNMLSFNPNAVYFLERNQQYIHWPSLCENKNAIRLLKNNKDKLFLQ